MDEFSIYQCKETLKSFLFKCISFPLQRINTYLGLIHTVPFALLEILRSLWTV